MIIIDLIFVEVILEEFSEISNGKYFEFKPSKQNRFYNVGI